jgi:peptidase C25-like protein
VTPSNLRETQTNVLKSDQNGLTVRVRLAQLQFVPATGNGKPFTKLVAPNTDSPGAPGIPGIPVNSGVLGVPDGANVQVKTSNLQSQTIDGVDVFPVQPDVADQAARTRSAAIITARRSKRSAITPPSGPATTIGATRAAVVRPSHVAPVVWLSTYARSARLYSQSPNLRGDQRGEQSAEAGMRERGVHGPHDRAAAAAAHRAAEHTYAPTIPTSTPPAVLPLRAGRPIDGAMDIDEYRTAHSTSRCAGSWAARRGTRRRPTWRRRSRRA